MARASITTSNSTAFPFANAQEDNLFRLSDGTLVLFYANYPASSYNTYWTVSTNNGATWSAPKSITANRYAITAIPTGNDNFLLLVHNYVSDSYGMCYSATYNPVTKVFVTAYLSTLTSYGVSGRIAGGFYWDSNYWTFYIRNNYRYVYMGYSSDEGETWTTLTSPLTSSTGANYCYHGDAVPIGNDKILVLGTERNTGRVKYSFITKTGENTYSWGAWSNLNNPENVWVHTDVTNPSAIRMYKVSDTEIWVACRTTAGFVFYKYDGNTWSDPISMSEDSVDRSGDFTKVNGRHVWAYISLTQQPDESYLCSIKGRIRKENGTWNSEIVLLPDRDAGVSLRRLTLETTENTVDKLQIVYFEGEGAPYTGYFDILNLPEGETINIEESLLVSESIENKVSQEYLNIEETVHLAENVKNNVSNEYFNVNESLEISDNTNLSIPGVIDIEETLVVDDSYSINTSEDMNFDESVSISEDSKVRTTINYPYKIISFNPLIVASKTNPVRISIIDVTDLNNIDWNGAIVVENVSDFNQITYNTLNEYIYMLCDSGEVIKISINNLYSQEKISIDSLPNITDGVTLSNRLQLYSISDSNTGELILLDEREMKSVSLDIKYVQEKVNFIPLDIRSIHSKNIPLNIIVLETNSKSIGLSFSFLKYAFDDASQYPIDYTKIQVKINNIDMSVLNDVDMSSIVITHNIESDKSNASFNLYRRFDDLNTTLNNVTSQITNKNTVQIFINGIKEFDGKISNLNVHTENEIVSVTCVGNRPKEQKNVVRIPFSRLNTNLHLYDCLLSNITMDNPPLDPDDETPEYYLGVEVDLGIRRTQQVQRWVSMNNALGAIERGTFQAQQNWSYFWFVSVERFWTDWIGSRRSYTTSSSYIGTSLSPAFSEDFKITYASYKTQKTYPDQESHLGFYRIGQAPYLPISAPNGMYIPKDRWEDRPNGLYRVTDASFNFTSVARNHARIEYEKLKNINGDILPRTSADVEITLDAYYFYNIKLLSRLNFSNTTKDNIYNKQNGFPVSVKLIVISTSNMRVQLQTDNNLSTLEIDALEDKKVTTNSCEKNGSEGLESKKYDLTGHGVV